MPIMILGLGLVLMLALGGGGGSAKAALPPKKDERGDLDIQDAEYEGRGGDEIERGGGGGQSDEIPGGEPGGLSNKGEPGGEPGGSPYGNVPGANPHGVPGAALPGASTYPGGGTVPGSSQAALSIAQQAGQRQAKAVVATRNASNERAEAIANANGQLRQDIATVSRTQGQIEAAATDARLALQRERHANALAEQAAAGRAQTQAAADQQANAALAAKNAADAAAEKARQAAAVAQTQADANAKAQADAFAQNEAAKAQALAQVAAQHAASALAARTAAEQKSAQEARARQIAEQAHQVAEQKIAQAKELQAVKAQQQAELVAKDKAAKEEIARKDAEAKRLAEESAAARKGKEIALQEAARRQKHEAQAAVAQKQQDLAEQKKKAAAAAKEALRLAAEQKRAKTAADKKALEAQRREAVARAQAEAKRLKDEKAAVAKALQVKQAEANNLKREIIRQTFVNAVERCMAFNPKAPRQTCVNSVAKLFAAKKVPLTANLGPFEKKTVDEVKAIVTPIPQLIQPRKATVAPPPKKVTPPKKAAPPKATPQADLDVDPVNYALYQKAIAAISRYLDNSIAKYPGIQKNLAKKQITEKARLMSAFFLPTMLEGIRQGDNVLVPSGPGGRMTKRFYTRTENDRVMVALVQPPANFKRRVLNGLIAAEKAIDSYGNPAYQSKWFVNGKYLVARGPRVSFLYKQFAAPAAVSGYLTIAGTPRILNDIYTGPGSEPGGGFFLRLGGWNS